MRLSKHGQALARQALPIQGFFAQKQLAYKCNYALSTVNRFLNGKPVRQITFYDLCDALRLPADEVIIRAGTSYTYTEGTTYTDSNEIKIARSIEFPPEYWEAGTSILSYFSRILNVKYPDKKIKVRIEQEDLTLRMVIDNLDGEREEIEKTLDDYALVVTGKLEAEKFLSDPLEVFRLNQKLEIAHLELRNTRQLLAFTKDNNQQRLASLEAQVKTFSRIIEKGLQSGDNAFGVMKKIIEEKNSTYDLSNAKFGGGFATDDGYQAGGNLIDFPPANNPTDLAQQIQDKLDKLINQGISKEDSIQQTIRDIERLARADPSWKANLVKQGNSLDNFSSEATKRVIYIVLKKLGIPIFGGWKE